MADLLTEVWSEQSLPGELTPLEWEDLIGQARRSRLLARLAHRAERWPGGLQALPSPQADYLRGAMRQVERQRHEVLGELNRIRSTLAQAPGPVVLLKGAAYLLAQLPPAAARVFSDVDLLVARAEVDAVETLLMGGGWISQERDAYNQRYYREWMHEIPPLAHVRRGSVIDLHHTISPPTSRFRVDGARLLAQIRPIGATGFYMLGPQDMVLHSAAHLYQEGEFDHGLRDLLDLNDLLLHFEVEPEFWPRLLDRAQELGLGEPLWMLLEQRRRLLGASPPEEALAGLDALRPDWARRTLVMPMLTRALRPHHPAVDTWASELSRSMLYIRSHRLRMPLRLLIPHLLRKAWMARFGPRAGEGDRVADAPPIG